MLRFDMYGATYDGTNSGNWKFGRVFCTWELLNL
jgi:hypothetical protein